MAVEEFHKEYGKDFVNFGFRPGGAVMLVNLGRNIHDVCRQDVYGTPVDGTADDEGRHAAPRTSPS